MIKCSSIKCLRQQLLELSSLSPQKNSRSRYFTVADLRLKFKEFWPDKVPLSSQVMLIALPQPWNASQGSHSHQEFLPSSRQPPASAALSINWCWNSSDSAHDTVGMPYGMFATHSGTLIPPMDWALWQLLQRAIWQGVQNSLSFFASLKSLNLEEDNCGSGRRERDDISPGGIASYARRYWASPGLATLEKQQFCSQIDMVGLSRMASILKS